MNCKYCNTPVIGRADKIFCNSVCRNNYNNAKRRETRNIVREVDYILHRNRIILEELMKSNKTGKMTIEKLILTKLGFNFNYYTGSYLNNQGKTYFYIYDYAWMPFRSQEIMITHNKNSLLNY